MERVEDEIGRIDIPLIHNFASTDFGLIDFTNETNFDQFIDLIRGDQPIVDFTSNIQGYNLDQQNTTITNVDAQFFPPRPLVDELFNFGLGQFDNMADHNIINNITSSIGLQNACQEKANDDNDDDDEKEAMDENESSGTTATERPTKKKSNKADDRSRTLVSERRRRGRMKEKLYALRSLVPNITKMDKASIVGDAVLYVQDLQMQAKRLKAEIAGLESSSHNLIKANNKIMSNTSPYPTTKKIFKMDVYQVEERGFYVRIVVANKGKGVAASLFKALESLITSTSSHYVFHTSNLAASAAQTYVFTFSLHALIKEKGIEIVNLNKMEVWIASVFLDQGFEFETSQPG